VNTPRGLFVPFVTTGRGARLDRAPVFFLYRAPVFFGALRVSDEREM
jgi:hypothetical protein